MSRRLMPVALMVTCALGLPEAVAAQRHVSFAADVSVGGGQGRGGEYHNRHLAGARLALSVWGGGTSAVLPYVELGMDWLAISKGDDLLCVPSPTGGCLSEYPELAGPGASVGLSCEHDLKPASQTGRRDLTLFTVR